MAGVHFKKTLIHVCTVQRSTPAQSSTGELIDSWADVGDVNCRYVQKKMDKALESVSLQEKVEHLMLMNNGEDVAEADRIVDIVRRSDGVTVVDAGPFTVEAFLERNADLASGHHISLTLERIE
jgi:predicted thioesterase